MRLALFLVSIILSTPSLSEEDVSVWPMLQEQIFGKKIPIENPSYITLEAPLRAEDAALVPVTIKIPSEVSRKVKKLTLIIDKNPAPVVAELEYGPAAGSGERILSTRVRVDTYSDIRAIVETEDGSLYMDKRFVKAAGGCSAPALKDTDAALANAGKIILKTIDTKNKDQMQEAQLMIKHPQYSGLQMNQATGLYIPPNFIHEIEVNRDQELIFRMITGMSISEDPNIRFTYSGSDDEKLVVVAKDTNGKIFTGHSLSKGS